MERQPKSDKRQEQSNYKLHCQHYAAWFTTGISKIILEMVGYFHTL